MDKKIQQIINDVAMIVAAELKHNYKLFLFGSRAKGVYNEKSDIDFGIISVNKITPKQIIKIQEKIDQLPTLLKIDFVDFNSVGEEFKKTALKHTLEIPL